MPCVETYAQAAYVYKSAPAYMNGVFEAVFKGGKSLPAGTYETDEDVIFIV